MPVLLDLFCCEGGASTGYARAGWDVVGADIEPQPNYPFPFLRANALEVLTVLIDGGAFNFRRHDGEHRFLTLADISAIHASPPCQAFSTITPAAARSNHPDLIAPTRFLLEMTGKPYVIENVEGARRMLLDPVKLCGSSFGIRVRRHRYFESNVALLTPPCDHARQPAPVGVYGDHADAREYLRPDGRRRGAKATSTDDARDAMGMPWASWHGLAEAIPPVFTEHIGVRLLAEVGA